jgi:hypothetical protein
MTTTKFGYVSAWAKNSFKQLTDEYDIADGLAFSGQLSIKDPQALIEYLSDPANMTEYGVRLDLGLFYDNTRKVPFSGALTTPYKKEDSSSTSSSGMKARRPL